MPKGATYTRAPKETDLPPMPCRSPFGYFGAKLKLASKIVEMLPPHAAWVEVFCGSAAITCAKQPVPIEVINDLDGQIVNVFQQLRTNPRRLINAISLTPYAKQELEFCRGNLDHRSPLERARRFLVFSMMTVNGTLGSRAGFSFSDAHSRHGREARVSRWLALPKRLQDVVNRLRNVRVENRDAVSIVRMFSDRPASLLYLDPPYFVKRRRGYVVDARHEEFHRLLLNACVKARCMMLISGYDTDLYNEALSSARGWSRVTIDTIVRDTVGKKYARREVLWMNKSFTRAKQSGRIPIRLTAEEKKNRKLNPKR